MVDFVRKQNFDPASFSNTNTDAVDAVKVRTDAGSVVDAAISAAISSIPPSPATSVPAAGVTAGTFVSGVNIPASQVTGLVPAVQTVINTASIPAAQLTGVVAAANLPSYVDDVLEVANFAALPATGEAGKIYVTADTSFIYRWTGSTYVQITSGGGAATVPASGVLAGTLGSGVQVNSTANFGAGAAATNTAPGVVQLATNPEAIAGTSTTLAVTPAGVAAAIAAAAPVLPVAATDTTLGLVENATASEVAAGTLDGAVSISPKDLIDGINTAGSPLRTAISSAATNTVPGLITWHAANTPPPGELKANGALLSRTTFAALFARIGTTFGVGDGSTTFGLPDLRGEFVRGWDDGRGIDTGRVFGSLQKGSLQFIDQGVAGVSAGIGSLNVNTTTPSVTRSTMGLDPWTPSDFSGANICDSGTAAPIVGAVADGASVAYGVARPRNIALLACIKY